MSTFEDSRSAQNQEHFEVIEIDLPVITGECTIGESPGYGTPLTCDQEWTGEYETYRFTNVNAPILKGLYHRCITNISEVTAKINPGNGLGARGTLTVTFADKIKNIDPNPSAPGVDATVTAQGSFFGKLAARQVFADKDVRVMLYRVEQDGTIDLENGALTRHYKGVTLSPSGGKWKLSCKDELKIVDEDETVWPITESGFLRQDIDASQVEFEVDSTVDYSNAKVVRIGDEYSVVVSITDNQGLDPILTVEARGSSISNSLGEIITRVNADEHSAGDEIFICDFSDNETIYDFLQRVLIDSELDPARIPYDAWKEEIDKFLPDIRINTIWGTAEDLNDVISMITITYLIDIVFNPESRLVELFAISTWQETKGTLVEGSNVWTDSFTLTANETIRTSRALVVYDKSFLAESDDVENYSKASTYTNEFLASEQLYGKHKDYTFDNSVLHSKESADLVTQRRVSRFGFKPKALTCKVSENKVFNKVGDVVNYLTEQDQDASGLPNSNARGQITQITPVYAIDGRYYKYSLATYEAAALDNSVFVITGNVGNGLNLYIQAGAPPEAVTVTFVFDAATVQSSSNLTPSVIAGNFAVGSVINIVLINGTDWQSKGGDGGAGQNIIWEPEFPLWIPQEVGGGLDGGTCYDAQGVTTNIYLSGTFSTYTAEGTLRAPSGGDGGFFAEFTQGQEDNATPGAGGRGGDGNNVGAGGLGGEAFNANANASTDGSAGKLDGSGSGWGLPGVDNDSTGGLAGKGIVKSGGIIRVYGADDLAPDGFPRGINGSGDTPDLGEFNDDFSNDFLN